MVYRSGSAPRASGQLIVLVAVVLALFLFAVGLVIDGGHGLAQRRSSQNASDFAALAGARVVAERLGGDTTNGTDANVRTAIANTVTANGGIVSFGSPDGPRYVDASGLLLGYVGDGMPANAIGVTVKSSRDWTPFFLGVFGIDTWAASAEATAKGGFSLAGPPPGTLFPIGISSSFFKTYPFCAGEISADPSSACFPQHLTPGNLNVPGGFGWLKFGCAGFGLGQEPPANNGGCATSKPFLQGEIGPPSNTYGCCTAVGLAGSADKIGSLPGNKVSADCSYYVDNEITVTVAIWDTAGGTGPDAWYHIVGYAGFQLTGCSGGKNIEGVWRRPFFTGAVTSTIPENGVPQPLGVQLVR
jgi:putative Flp pilus-assembly TadE/G-like protein